MKKCLNSICSIICNDGRVEMLPKTLGSRHNEALSECASKLGYDLPIGSLPSMFEIIVKKNDVIFLNHGKSKYLDQKTNKLVDKWDISIVLPESISLNHIENFNLDDIEEFANSINLFKYDGNRFHTYYTNGSISSFDILREEFNKNNKRR
ncbi:MAG: hypothetical protein PHQ64_02815 [Bacilli bacterium]|nr:hypothetical protein [Bacilli bacterium]